MFEIASLYAVKDPVLNDWIWQLYNYSQQKCPTIDSQGIHPKSACACDHCQLDLHKHMCVYDTLYHAHLRPLCALHFSMHLSTNVIIHMFVSRCWYKRGAPAPYWYWSVICKVLSESGYAFSRLAIHVDWLLWLQQISLFLVLFKVLWLDYSGCFCLSQPF